MQKRYSFEIPEECEFGPGLRLYHTVGIVLGGVKVGSNCSLWQDVTIGNNIRKECHGVAIIGDFANICAGAKIIGKIKIGNNVTIGANAVVVKDVSDNSIVGGVPSNLICFKDQDDHEGYYFDYLTFQEWRLKKYNHLLQI